MAKRLHIGEDFALPLDAITQTLVVYGGKGMGKTNFAAVLVEELHKHELKFSVLDPLGVNWGLQHGRTKDTPGLKIVILGGVHGDIPIEPTAGAVVADFVADEAISTVVDISRKPNGAMWSFGERIRFVKDYSYRLFERQGERRFPLMQVIDEAGRFVPQMIPSGAKDLAECVGAIEQLVEWGRNVGIGVTLITQRSARMNKSVSELAECMIAFRTIGPNSVGAVMDWMGEHVEKERLKTLVEEVRKLKRGTALIVSPGWLQFEGVADIRMRETFDSSKTPEPGVEPRAPGKAAKPDLDAYLQRMKQTVEKAKAEDPKELRRRIQELEAQLRKGPGPDAAVVLALKQEREAQQAQIEKFAASFLGLEKWASSLVDTLRSIAKLAGEASAVGASTKMEIPIRDVEKFIAANAGRQTAVKSVNPAPEYQKKVITPATRAEAAETGLDGTQQRTLDTIAMLNVRGITVTREAVARWMGIHPNGGRFLSGLGALRANGYLVGWTLLETGRAAAREQETGIDAAVAAVKDGTCKRSFQELIAAHPQSLTREQLAERLGIHPNGGRFLTGLSWLRQMGVITERSPISVTEGAFR